MATFRVGVGSFNIKDGAVGFGTDTDGLGNLKVKGVTKTTDIKVSGASTLTRYSGFAADNINQLENITLTSEVGTIGDIVVGVGTSVIISSASTVTVGTVESVSIGTHFSPPKGGIEERGQDFLEGMMRFNTDLNTMEFYNGNEWRQFTYITDIQNSPLRKVDYQPFPSSRGRGVFSGFSPGFQNKMVFIEIMTTGNALDFGTNETGVLCAGTSNGTRGVYSGGAPVPYKDKMEYITIASAGNPIDFGDLTQNRGYAGGASSSTRGLVIGGYFNPAYTNIIDYHQIATLGNAIDFGDTRLKGKAYGATQNPIKAVFQNGDATSDSFFDTVKISTLGNSRSFGELTQKRVGLCGAGNAVRGIFFGGYLGGTTHKNTIDYVTFASEGNAIDFGDRTFTGSYSSAVSNSVRVVTAGAFTPSALNHMEFVTIATTGNATDFGDCPDGSAPGSVSDSHGGLGGY